MDKRLEKIKEHRKCQRLPFNASKQEKVDSHKVKMATKKIYRQRMREHLLDTTPTPCNLSVNHEDYGLTHEQHQEEKANRNRAI